MRLNVSIVGTLAAAAIAVTRKTLQLRRRPMGIGLDPLRMLCMDEVDEIVGRTCLCDQNLLAIGSPLPKRGRRGEAEFAAGVDRVDRLERSREVFVLPPPRMG